MTQITTPEKRPQFWLDFRQNGEKTSPTLHGEHIFSTRFAGATGHFPAFGNTPSAFPTFRIPGGEKNMLGVVFGPKGSPLRASKTLFPPRERRPGGPKALRAPCQARPREAQKVPFTREGTFSGPGAPGTAPRSIRGREAGAGQGRGGPARASDFGAQKWFLFFGSVSRWKVGQK